MSADVTQVPFDLPPQSYSFDTRSWNLPMGTFPEVPCGPNQVVVDCCHPPAPLPAPDCGLTPLDCESGACTLRFPISVVQQVNLAQDVPQLANIGNQTLVDVFVSQIRYSVTSSLNVEMPSVDLYVAPDGVTSASNPAAEKFGTVPVTPAMSSGDGMVDIVPDSQQIFAKYAHQPATPFNFIATTTIVLPSGSRIPNGHVDISVTGQVSASLAGG